MRFLCIAWPKLKQMVCRSRYVIVGNLNFHMEMIGNRSGGVGGGEERAPHSVVLGGPHSSYVL